MRFPVTIALLAGSALPFARAAELPDILARLSEEAEVFRQQAPQLVGEETFSQRALNLPRRHLQVGKAATSAAPSWQSREVVSEYSLGTLKSAPENLHEFREIVSVDGRRVTSTEKARHALALGMQSDDDRHRKKMLEAFQRYGFHDAAVDLGPLLLLFTKRHLGDFRFEITPETMRVGADEVQVVSYKQLAGPESTVIFSGRQLLRQPLAGKIYVRKSDALPVRVTMEISRAEERHRFRDEAVVDYVPNAHGFLAPASAVHRGYADETLMVENQYRYTPFKKFAAEAEIKFTEVPEPPK